MSEGLSQRNLPWWNTQLHAARRPRLVQRGRIIAGLRGWFAGEGFTEVETGQLQISPGNEAHLSAFASDFIDLSGSRTRLYLHTSPEFAAKKLMAAGEMQIVAFARCFRNREASRLHAPEFTMLEWYRAHAPLEALIDDCEALIQLSAEVTGASHLRFGGKECDPRLPAERLGVCEALARHAGIDLLATISSDGNATDRNALADQARAIGIRITEDDSWSDIFSKLLSEKVEPHLGMGRATVLMDYPAPEAALARRKSGEPRLSERFELYACGVELANAFGELTDAAEQRRRFIAEMDEKQRIYGERYPLDEDLLAALPHMPPTSGIALGLDRLVMLATGAAHINDVLWTPFPIHG
ncbi:MAG: EF-P lysine aminoacylase EpmA [Bosea sp. (in: a-proteobacteria)]